MNLRRLRALVREEVQRGKRRKEILDSMQARGAVARICQLLERLVGRAMALAATNPGDVHPQDQQDLGLLANTAYMKMLGVLQSFDMPEARGIMNIPLPEPSIRMLQVYPAMRKMMVEAQSALDEVIPFLPKAEQQAEAKAVLGLVKAMQAVLGRIERTTQMGTGGSNQQRPYAMASDLTDLFGEVGKFANDLYGGGGGGEESCRDYRRRR